MDRSKRLLRNLLISNRRPALNIRKNIPFLNSLMLLLENNGIIVSKVNIGAKKVDACSVLVTDGEKRPLISLTPDTSAVRSRRDAAHELGHHILHSWADKDYFENNRKRMDEEAEWFASAFLMPAEAIRREVFAATSIDSIILLKKRWKVSAQSIVYYTHELGILTENQFNYLRSKMYSRGWRQSEPLDDEIEQEGPRIIKQACELILDNNIKSPAQFVEDLSFPYQDIENLCSLERGTLFEKTVPALRIVKSNRN
jgi:Zn-dependent peptidase ImmA (M78 family)